MGRVLLIEDSPPLSRIIGWILREGGHDVRSVAEASGSAEEAAAYHPNVVVFNTGMPDALKAPYVERIREAAPDARIIDLAVDADARAARAADHAGGEHAAAHIDRFLRVPFHADDLLQAVRELMPAA